MPSTKSSAKIMYDLGQELLKKGHDVSIITISENLTTPLEVVIEDGLRILRVKSGKIDGANKYIRFINELFLSQLIWYRGNKFFKEFKCDLVVWYSPSIFFSRLISKIKGINNCPSYLILRDIFPQWALDTGLLKNGVIYNILQYFEFQQYKVANVIGVQSPKNLDYFDKLNVQLNSKLEVLYNWVDLKKTCIQKTNFRDTLNLNEKIVFFYGGNIGVAQDMDNIIRLAYNLRYEKKAHFLIVGEGSESTRLKKMILSLGLENVNIFGSVGQDTYLAMLSEFDIGLISLNKSFKTPNFPGKMLGYMYFSKPILASINMGNDLQTLLEEYNAGLVSINGDDDQFVENSIKLISDQEFRINMGKNGKKVLNNFFSVTNASQQILSNFID